MNQTNHNENSPETQNGRIQAVIFDLDGVLIDSETIAFQVIKELTAWYGGELADEHFLRMVGMTAEETVAYVVRVTGVTVDPDEVIERSWQETMARLNQQAAPLPGAEALVRLLFERGVPIGIASNSPTYYIQNALAGLKMVEYFPVQVGVEQVAAGKPAPDVYLAAARQLGVPPEHCLAVEDSRVGMRAAAAAGMRVVAVPAAHDTFEGFDLTWKISKSLTEVAALIEPLLP